MSVTQIDIDDNALKEAMRMMGTTTKKDTVNLALREYVARVKRIEALERLAARAQRGEFDEAAAAHQAAKAAWKQAIT
ncbi:type II toxin-antitoxin system VapB family antitoxin [Nonomuraea angiospora]|uniref:Arc/MetJ family transcription regulator n=2 Tax=Nonomuraea TaxID=83681 RepID=A0A7W9G3F8_9ACTN|nr:MULTISPECIES: type II toxin-antitoxin system VapB family antitoxin [Nonomuraea]MBB5776454.1 Arc/MetJ family transcription regulator [Nonomuraea jabiensis]MBE1589441.1 Arc/MetJ family transcription regulator [Nonomuraea angiospora]